jgi:hypothetical protein
VGVYMEPRGGGPKKFGNHWCKCLKTLALTASAVHKKRLIDGRKISGVIVTGYTINNVPY